MAIVKQCSKCRKQLPLEMFCKSSCTKSGLACACKVCHRKRGEIYRANNLEKCRASSRRYAHANKEKVREVWRNWIAKPENKEKTRLKNKRLHAADPVKRLENNRKWRALNPEKISEYCRKWRSANPEKVKQRCQKRRAIKKGAQHTPYTKAQVLALRGQWCGICGLEIDLSVKYPHPMSFSFDHIQPLTKGGIDAIENIQPAHYSCNCKKLDRTFGLSLVANGGVLSVP
ncbi:MAG: HNH endonuclease [Candidatus Hydrogenedentes bacterium]|nr:HNH endonuclease [Candidatus Hydrogenedentota bacterium]